MIVAILVILAILASTGIHLSYKLGSERTVDPISSPPLMCSMASLFIALLYFIVSYITGDGIAFPNKMSYVYAVIVGISYAGAAFCYLLALSSGPYTLSLIVINVSAFMPILYSRFILNEPVSAFQLIGLAIMIVACVLLTIVRNRGVKNAKINFRWCLFALGTFVFNSFISFAVRVNTKLAPETDSSSLYFLAYIISMVFCFLFFVFTGGIRKKISPKPLIAPAVGVGFFLALQLTPIAYLPKYLLSAVQYPLVNGSSLIFGIIVAVMFLKEKLPKSAYILVGAIIAAMFLLGL